jgi:hypothetical protein
MTAPLIDIADAVVAALNTAANPAPPNPPGPPAEPVFAQPFTAVRKVLPVYDLAELAGVHVTVVPRGADVTGATRSASQYDLHVDVGVQKKLGADLEAETAGMLALVDQIATFLARRPMGGAAWVRAANDQAYLPDHLADKRLFTSVLTVTYRMMR